MGVVTTVGAERPGISEEQLRYLALHAALVAADALTDSTLPGERRLETLTRAYGMVMALRGPGHPLDFEEFRRRVRGPVATLLPPGVDDAGLATVFAIDRATGERNVDLEALDGEFGAAARLSGGLPHWTWLRDELSENQAYALFRRGENQKAYESRRRFVIGHPAGTKAELRAMPRELEELYHPVPGHRRYDRWCFLCPVCRWPMRVQRRGRVIKVACDDPGHRERGADYRSRADDGTDAALPLTPAGPAAAVTAAGRLLAPPAGQVVAHEADRVSMVEQPCWRSHVVPGLLELALTDELQARGAQVDLWPGLDSYDLHITAPSGRFWKVDVKDVISVDALIRRTRGSDGSGLTMVVPYRLSSQVPLLERALKPDGWKVRTATRLARDVCLAAGRSWP